MQLGRRWRFGGTPPESLTARFGVLTEQLAAYEQRASSASEAVSDAGADAVSDAAADAAVSPGFWTLTWLEGLPRVAAPNGDILTVDHAGSFVLLRDWQAGEARPYPVSGFGGGSADSSFSEFADDDDDWLSGS